MTILIKLAALIAMTSPILRIKEFLTMTCKAYNDNLTRGLPTTSIDSGAPLKEDLNTHESDKKNREVFRKFYEEVLKPDFSMPACKYKLIDDAYECLGNEKI